MPREKIDPHTSTREFSRDTFEPPTKATSDLTAGERFTLEDEAGVTFTFLRWTGAAQPGRQAMVRRAMLRTHEGRITPRVLNMAGSVKMSCM